MGNMFKRFSSPIVGEIACRVIRTAKKLGIATAAVYSDADRDAMHVPWRMRPSISALPLHQSYIVIENILAAIRRTGADAVHPGYGFLSENAAFAEARRRRRDLHRSAGWGDRGDGRQDHLEEARRGSGRLHRSRHMGLIEDADEAARIAAEIGFPVMMQGFRRRRGKGMRIAWNEREHERASSRRRRGESSFGDDRIFIENS